MTGYAPGGGKEFRFRDARPHMKRSAAASSATAAAPIAIPAMAPPVRPELLFDATAAAVVADAAGTVDDVDVAAAEVELGTEEEAVEKGLVCSDGHASPGWSMNVEFFAICVCSATDSVPFGLMTPTIP